MKPILSCIYAGAFGCGKMANVPRHCKDMRHLYSACCCCQMEISCLAQMTPLSSCGLSTSVYIHFLGTRILSGKTSCSFSSHLTRRCARAYADQQHVDCLDGSSLCEAPMPFTFCAAKQAKKTAEKIKLHTLTGLCAQRMCAFMSLNLATCF